MDSFYRGSYDKHPEYTAETINSKRTLFVPENPVEINRLEYYIDYLDIGDLKSALFINPKYVRQEPVSVGEEYTDGTRLMTVNKDNYLISYINPAQKDKLFGSSSDLCKKALISSMNMQVGKITITALPICRRMNNEWYSAYS